MRMKAAADADSPRSGNGTSGRVLVEQIRNRKEAVSAKDMAYLSRLERGLSMSQPARDREAAVGKSGRSRLLSQEEEKEVFTIYSRARGSLERLRGELAASGNGRPESTITEISRLEETCRLVKSIAVLSNQGLVWTMAARMKRRKVLRHVELGDLVQEGNVAMLTRAVELFDLSRDTRFCTYAAWWIYHGMEKSISMNDGLHGVRFPSSVQENLRRIAVVTREHYNKTGGKPTKDEVIAAAGVDPDKFQKYQSMRKGMNQDQDDRDPVLANLPDANALSPEQALVYEQDRLIAGRLFDSLTPKEADVISRRFGFGSGDEHTLQEIADSYGVTREAIRQTEITALRKMRKRYDIESRG